MARLAWLLLFAVSFACAAGSALAGIAVHSGTLANGARYIVLAGTFELGDDVGEFVAEALRTDPVVVVFDSPGGNVYSAMTYGRTIRTLGLATLQPRSFECASACAFAFVGGAARFAESGAIGVHQSSFAADAGLGSQAAVAAIQAGTADVMAYLVEMGIDPRLLQLSLQTGSDDMRYLTSAEMAEYRVIQSDEGAGGSRAPAVAATPSTAPTAEPDGGSLASGWQPFDEARNGSAPSPGAAAPPERHAALEPSMAPAPADPNRPDRIALYRGLDFMGRDIGSASVADAPTCSARCLATPFCKAFTFNTATAEGRGPNCFLKDSRGQLDGNAVAISGMVLGRMEADAEIMSFGIIDPARNLYDDTDAPGGDLNRTPLTDATTAARCRIACVNNGSCAAFSFVEKRRQCWLKAGVGSRFRKSGVVTGVKSAMTFEPTHVTLE